jgi:hypothetical protein
MTYGDPRRLAFAILGFHELQVVEVWSRKPERDIPPRRCMGIVVKRRHCRKTDVPEGLEYAGNNIGPVMERSTLLGRRGQHTGRESTQKRCCRGSVIVAEGSVLPIYNRVKLQ